MADEHEVTEKGGVRGRFRLQVVNEDGTIDSDSGYHENVITNTGFLFGIVSTAGAGLAGGSTFGFLALGSGGLPASNDVVLAGEVIKRQALTAATSSDSHTLHNTGTFLSTNSFVTSQKNLSNIGIFPTSGASSLYCGNTYASQSCNTNQNVNCFTQGHLVLLADGSEKPIEALREGDELLGFDEATGALESTRVVARRERRADETLMLRFASERSLRCTPEHPFYVGARSGWVTAEDLGIGDEVNELCEVPGYALVLQNGDALVGVERIEELRSVYNIQCAPHQNYFVEGLLVHNCTYDIIWS